MKNWSAVEWCLFIMTLTIPLAIAGVIIIRLVTGEPISDKAADIVQAMLNIVAGGVLTTIGSMLGIKNKENKPNVD